MRILMIFLLRFWKKNKGFLKSKFVLYSIAGFRENSSTKDKVRYHNFMQHIWSLKVNFLRTRELFPYHIKLFVCVSMKGTDL